MKEFQAIFEDGCVKLIALNKTVSQVPTGYLYIYMHIDWSNNARLQVFTL